MSLPRVLIFNTILPVPSSALTLGVHEGLTLNSLLAHAAQSLPLNAFNALRRSTFPALTCSSRMGLWSLRNVTTCSRQSIASRPQAEPTEVVLTCCRSPASSSGLIGFLFQAGSAQRGSALLLTSAITAIT